jgi:hypothetical protein
MVKFYEIEGNINNKEGVYRITNVSNNKIYIGMSSKLLNRLQEHYDKLTNNKHTNKKLQQDFNRFSVDNFDIDIIKYTENSHEAFLLEQKTYNSFKKRELYNISFSKDGFNKNLNFQEFSVFISNKYKFINNHTDILKLLVNNNIVKKIDKFYYIVNSLEGVLLKVDRSDTIRINKEKNKEFIEYLLLNNIITKK